MRFEKVNEEFFRKDSLKNCMDYEEGSYDKIVIPTRKTAKSAGYDFVTPYSFDLYPGERKTIPSGIKATDMPKDTVLMLFVRSSVGIKYGIVLPNGTGIIDADYANNEENDGDIQLALWNSSSKMASFKAGDRIAQGIFVKYGIVEDDDADGIRTGGIGSSGK